MILLTEAGIPRDLFLQVQEEMVRRARLETGTGKRRVYSGKYALSHLFIALTAETFTAGLSGGFAARRSRSGVASVGSRKEKRMWTAHHGPFTRRICTRLL